MQLTKHHALGNDFLVLVDLDGTAPITADDARALCERHTGIGADGVLRVTPGTDGADVTMGLLNADGSRAEMSGNGLRCLAQAVFQAGIVEGPVLHVATDVGMRTVRVLSQSGPGSHRMSVEMGQAKIVGAEPQWLDPEVARAVRVDLGNPHVVLRWRGGQLPGRYRLAALGAQVDAATPGGANLELIKDGVVPGTLDMVVYERGVGPTLACGTGACAAAAAAHDWGMCGPSVTVSMPGGSVDVALGDPVVLTGDVTSVAAVDTRWP